MKSVYKRRRKSPAEGGTGKRARNDQLKGWEKKGSMRRDGLLNQFLQRNKTSVVVDGRLAERSSVEEEEKIARRMAAEKSKQYSKKSIFNLNDDEEESLTHKGESIADMERYDDPRDHSGSEDELLDKNFVGEAHFGGFMRMKKKGTSEEMDVDEDKGKSRKEIIEELILANKAKKLEKAKHGDEYLSKVGDLNTMFRDEGILSLVQSNRTKKEEVERIMAPTLPSPPEQRVPVGEESQRPQDQAFGRLLRELKFESKPARVDQVQVRGVTTSADIGIDWNIDTLSIPLPISIPSTYKEYVDFLAKYATDDNDEYEEETFSYIHHKMIDNHLVAHRGKLSDLCAHLIQFTLDLADSLDITDPKCVVNFTPFIFHRIIESSPQPADLADLFVEKIKEAHDTFIRFSSRRLEDSHVALLTLCPTIFSNSEVRHRVLSPALILLFQIISEFKVTKGKTARQILHLCYASYSMVEGTKRYAPETLRSLCSLLHCFHNGSSLESDLVGMEYHLSSNAEEYEAYKLIVPILALIKKFLQLYSGFPTASDMFRPIRDALIILQNREWIESEWPTGYTTDLFRKHLTDLISGLDNLSAVREPPRTAISLPKPLKLYEPEFQEVFSGRKRAGTRDQQDRSRLLHKIKQEEKGAIRELKKDSAFLARAQQHQQSQLDETRKRKVNLIMGSLSNQEGDFKKIRRGK